MSVSEELTPEAAGNVSVIKTGAIRQGEHLASNVAGGASTTFVGIADRSKVSADRFLAQDAGMLGAHCPCTCYTNP